MENEVKNGLVVADDSGIAGKLTGATKDVYTSLPMETEAEKIKVFNVSSNTDNSLRDFIGKIISIKDVYVEQVELMNEKTGELQNAPRIILIDDKGVSYATVSKGVFNSLTRIFGLFGTPETWTKPVKVEVKQKSSKEKVVLLLTLVG